MFNLGIDIAKKGHVAALVEQDGKLLVASFKFTNTPNGFAKLCARLELAGLTQEETLVALSYVFGARADGVEEPVRGADGSRLSGVRVPVLRYVRRGFARRAEGIPDADRDRQDRGGPND